VGWFGKLLSAVEIKDQARKIMGNQMMNRYVKTVFLVSVLLMLSQPSMAEFKKKSEKAPTPSVIELTQSQLAMAERVYTGVSRCPNDNANVEIDAVASKPGFFKIKAAGLEYLMHPAITASNIVRLENASGEIIWIQASNTSMLLNSKLSKRLMGSCTNQRQDKVMHEIDEGKKKGLMLKSSKESTNQGKITIKP
jgi:hypothetical protein